MQSVVQTIIDASNKIVQQHNSIDSLEAQIATDNDNFDDIYDSLVAKGQTPTKADRTTYAPCIDNLNVAGSFQSKTVTPSDQQQTITPDSGYIGLDEVIVETDEFLLPENIRDGVTIFGVTGTYTGQ